VWDGGHKSRARVQEEEEKFGGEESDGEVVVGQGLGVAGTMVGGTIVLCSEPASHWPQRQPSNNSG
jgi:hypothetical protein